MIPRYARYIAKNMSRQELLQGTLDMLVLRVLSGGALHGWGIAQKIHLLSRDILSVEEGSLYPALYRMEQKGWITSEWGVSETKRKAKFYSLTETGRRQLDAETENWARLAKAIGLVMGEAAAD